MKKVLAVFLCSAMTLSLAACSKSSNGASNAGTSNTAKSSAGNYSNHLKISWATVQVQSGVDYNNGDDFTKQWCKKYNIEWDIIPVTFDNWADKLRVWINSGDMPDMCTWNYIHGEAANYVDQGLVKELPSNWKTTYPNLAKAYEGSKIGPELDKRFQGTYFLTRPVFFTNKPVSTLVSHMSVYMRKDWATAVGFPLKDYYKASELMQFAKLVKQKDPGHVGAKLTGLNTLSVNMPWAFVFANSTYSQLGGDYYKDSSGKYQWGPADQDTLTGLKLYQQAYREGLINPDFYTVKTGQDTDAFYTAGTSAMCIDAGLASVYDQYATNMKKNLNLDPNKALWRAFVIGEDGKYHCPEVINFWAAQIFSPKISDEKLSRILDMMDYSCTKEGTDTIRLGIKNKDWSLNSDGSFKCLDTTNTNVSTKYKSIIPIYMNMFVLSDDFGLVDPTISQAYRDNTKKLYQEREKLGDANTIPSTDWTAYFQNSSERQKVAFDYGAEYAQLILKSGDIEKNWNTWVKQKMLLVQPVLDQLDKAK